MAKFDLNDLEEHQPKLLQKDKFSQKRQTQEETTGDIDSTSYSFDDR